MSRFAPAFSLLALVVACGHAAPQPSESPPPPAKPAPRAPSEVEAARQDLLEEVQRSAARDDVLGALPPPARERINGLLERVKDDERKQLMKSPGARESPLFHLAAGGSEREAYFQLLLGRGVDELLVIQRALGKTGAQELLQPAVEIVRRAAHRFLHQVEPEVKSDALSASLCDQIDRAGAALDDPALRLAARRMAALLDPQAGRFLAAARAATWALDSKAARALLKRAIELDAKTPSDELNAKIAIVESVEQRGSQPSDPKSRLELARGLLTLSRPRDAVDLLQPDSAEAKQHLGLATTLALAKLGGSICPGMPSGSEVPLLCAAAWQHSPVVAEAQALLESAWKSGKGRDTQAIESYLTLARVVPVLYMAQTPFTSPDAAQREFAQRLEALAAAVQEGVKLDASFAGLELFVDTMRAGLEASRNRKPDSNVSIPADVQKRLVASAEALAKKSPEQPFTQAGVLSVAALLVQERDPQPLLGLLPPNPAPEYRRTRGVLRLWAAVTQKDAKLLEAAQSELVAELPDNDASLERATLVLTLAESEVAIKRSRKSYEVLGKVAGQLSEPGTPDDLRLRAALDVAATAIASGDAAGADKLLTQIAGLQVNSRNARDLTLVAKTYLLVRRAQAAKGGERADYQSKLKQLTQEYRNAGAGLGIRTWHELWVEHLSYEDLLARCGGVKACSNNAKLARSALIKKLLARLGPQQAKLLRNGVLSAGSVSATFSASGERGLMPVVQLQSQFPALDVPKLDD